MFEKPTAVAVVDWQEDVVLIDSQAIEAITIWRSRAQQSLRAYQDCLQALSLIVQDPKADRTPESQFVIDGCLASLLVEVRARRQDQELCDF